MSGSCLHRKALTNHRFQSSRPELTFISWKAIHSTYARGTSHTTYTWQSRVTHVTFVTRQTLQANGARKTLLTIFSPSTRWTCRVNVRTGKVKKVWTQMMISYKVAQEGENCCSINFILKWENQDFFKSKNCRNDCKDKVAHQHEPTSLSVWFHTHLQQDLPLLFNSRIKPLSHKPTLIWWLPFSSLPDSLGGYRKKSSSSVCEDHPQT